MAPFTVFFFIWRRNKHQTHRLHCQLVSHQATTHYFYKLHSFQNLPSSTLFYQNVCKRFVSPFCASLSPHTHTNYISLSTLSTPFNSQRLAGSSLFSNTIKFHGTRHLKKFLQAKAARRFIFLRKHRQTSPLMQQPRAFAQHHTYQWLMAGTCHVQNISRCQYMSCWLVSGHHQLLPHRHKSPDFLSGHQTSSGQERESCLKLEKWLITDGESDTGQLLFYLIYYCWDDIFRK